ncbi:SRPBCC domain-containing protein [Kitasatospora nipponensis]|uniref:SRPBCC domain-containing protein n=1 Tax=Kitasatospora nipponensis TaxID=258049 RepID=A0ABP4HML3_9ACTN
MEHEVVIQLPAELVLSGLEDPALLARCIPGLSTEATEAGGAAEAPGRAARRGAAPGPEEISGRLRLRIGGSTITYRGVISLIRTGGTGVLTALVEGQEVRGEGEVEATLRLGVEADGPQSTRLRFRGDLTPGGRLADFDAEALAAAGHRLLDRFSAALAAATSPDSTPAQTSSATPALTAVPSPPAQDDDEQDEDRDAAARTGEGEGRESGDELPDDLFGDDLSDLIAFSDPEGFGLTAEPEELGEGADRDAAARHSEGPGDDLEVPYGFPRSTGDAGAFGGEVPLSPDDVLAGPVRRSIVGRSAEEVDHAPPRGRYAPALPARSARARAASRWYGDQGTAPVASRVSGRLSTPWVIGGGVALLGGAVVLARALRRR